MYRHTDVNLTRSSGLVHRANVLPLTPPWKVRSFTLSREDLHRPGLLEKTVEQIAQRKQAAAARVTTPARYERCRPPSAGLRVQQTLRVRERALRCNDGHEPLISGVAST